MIKIEGTWYWLTMYRGHESLQAAPCHTDGRMDPEEACDVSRSAFNESEFDAFTLALADAFGRSIAWAASVVRG